MVAIVQHTSNHELRDSTFVAAANEVDGKFVEVTIDAFMDVYFSVEECPTMPDVTQAHHDQFLSVAAISVGDDILYDAFAVAMSPFLAPGWVLVNTSQHVDPEASRFFTHSEIKPDMALYRRCHWNEQKICDASAAEQFGEFKLDPDDEPFRWDEKPSDAAFERPTTRARETRGQLTVYLNAIQVLQQRTRVFSFYVRENWCRLLLQARSGITVSSLFDWTKTDHLQRYFWIYTHSSPEQRGYDTTITPLTDCSLTLEGNRKIRMALCLGSDDPIYSVTVNDDKKKSVSFYVSRPFTDNHTVPIGRATRCFVAYDPTNGNVVLLKDTWRVEGHRPEHEIYEMLHRKGVPNIPMVVAAGHVPNHFARCEGPQGKLIHYRIVLNVVGRPLSTFNSTHQMVCIIRDALEAHRRAWEPSPADTPPGKYVPSILHRDISFGNIIIVNGRGMLIDWELSKIEGEEDPRARRRTGTWPFLAARLLKDPQTAHEACDDIESFVYLLLWTAARYAPNNMTPKGRAVFLHRFERQSPTYAAHMKQILLESDVARTLELDSAPLRRIITDLVKHLAFRHPERWKEGLSSKGIDRKQRLMLTHEWMATYLDTALREWQETDDGSIPHTIKDIHVAVQAPEDRRKRRKAEWSLCTDQVAELKSKRARIAKDCIDDDMYSHHVLAFVRGREGGYIRSCSKVHHRTE